MMCLLLLPRECQCLAWKSEKRKRIFAEEDKKSKLQKSLWAAIKNIVKLLKSSSNVAFLVSN